MIKRLLFLLCIISLSGCFKSESDQLWIAASANTQFMMEELIKAFEQASNINCRMSVSSSGTLTAQLMEGAPYHIFFSADLKYPNQLYQAGLTHAPPEVYAYGQLVLWSGVKNLLVSIDVLNTNKTRHIAMPNPEVAPYGRAAQETLNHYGLWDTLQSKIIYGESISQINSFINLQAAEIGFTSKSVVLSDRGKNKGNWITIDPASYTPIEQGLVILKGTPKEVEKAKKFRDFVFSDQGKEILNKFGYLVSEE